MNFCLLSLVFGVVASALLAPMFSPEEVEITGESHHHAVFENASIRVFSVEVAPHSDTEMHWHRHDYFMITLGRTDILNEIQGKPPAEMKLQDGETRFSPASFVHLVRNRSDQPFRNVTVELLQDDKWRAHPAKWDEERGFDILHGGTRQILFVEDGVRVTEFELQPGAMIPRHRHAGPHLLVAVSDLNFRSDVEGKGITRRQFKSGETKWVEGGFTHTLTNAGTQPAKFVTLEFP